MTANCESSAVIMLLGANTIGTKSPVWCSTEILQVRPNYRKSLSLHDVFVNCFVRLQPCCNDHRFRSTTPTLVCRIHHKLIPTPVLGQLYHFRSWNPESDSNTPSRPILWCKEPLRNQTRRSTSAKLKTSRTESTQPQLYKTSKISIKLLLSTKLWWFQKSLIFF